MHITGLLEDDNCNSSHTHFFAMCVIKGSELRNESNHHTVACSNGEQWAHTAGN